MKPEPAAAPTVQQVPAAVMDRVLLYLRGMDIPPVQSLELALETFRRLAAEPGREPVSMPEAMKALHALLRESKLHSGWLGPGRPPRPSMPPLNRCSMIAEKMEFLWPCFRRPSKKRRPGQTEAPDSPAGEI